MIQGAPLLKRLFQEMEVEEAPLRTKEKDKVREVRKTILKPPTGPLSSDQKAQPYPTTEKKLVKKEVAFEDTRAQDTVGYLKDLVHKSLQAKSSLTMDNLLKVSPTYKEALLAYVRAADSTYEVVNYKGSSTPGQDTARTAPKEGEGLP